MSDRNLDVSIKTYMYNLNNAFQNNKVMNIHMYMNYICMPEGRLSYCLANGHKL